LLFEGFPDINESFPTYSMIHHFISHIFPTSECDLLILLFLQVQCLMLNCEYYKSVLSMVDSLQVFSSIEFLKPELLSWIGFTCGWQNPRTEQI